MSTAVDSLTQTMASTSITDNGASSAAANEGRRLYIGNVAYATTPEELNGFFKGYSIENTIIPTNPRTQRPVGYAFVEVGTVDEAQKAMQELSGQELGARKVSVQLARKPEDVAAARQAAQAARQNGGDENAQGGEDGLRGRGGRYRGRGRGARGGNRGVNADGTAPTNVSGQVLPLTDSTNAGDAGATGVDGEQKQRGPRPQRQRGPPEDGVPSKTKVMVANIPYELTEEQLSEMFAAYQPTSAKIALRPIPRFMIKKLISRNEPRKGRGFGFVTLASEELQQRAVSEMNGKTFHEREIVVKVAIDSPGKEDAEGATADATLQDATSGAPAPLAS